MISTTPPSSSSSRPVLLWQEEGDATRVEPSLEKAAEFLKASADDVRAAIERGEVLGGWFADWEAEGSNASE